MASSYRFTGSACFAFFTAVVLAPLCAGAADSLAVVTQTQDGFGGRSGTRTTLATNGDYFVERIVDGRPVARLRSCSLSREQLEAARAGIAAARLPDQPERTGEAPPVNQRVVTIEAAGVTRSVVGPPPLQPAPAMPDDGELPGPVAALARSLQELTRR